MTLFDKLKELIMEYGYTENEANNLAHILILITDIIDDAKLEFYESFND